MNEERRMEVRPVPAGKDSRSCAACGRKNYGDGKARIFDLVFGNTVVGICQDCMLQLAQDMADAVSGETAAENPKNWHGSLLCDLLGTRTAAAGTVLYDAQLDRLKQALAAMPQWPHYAALLRSRAGRWPDPDAAGTRHMPGWEVKANADAAMEHLRAKPRLDYIADGSTDLDAYFDQDLFPWLRRHGFLVLADLAAWDDGAIFSGSAAYDGIDSRTVAQAYHARKSLGMLPGGQGA